MINDFRGSDGEGADEILLVLVDSEHLRAGGMIDAGLLDIWEIDLGLEQIEVILAELYDVGTF